LVPFLVNNIGWTLTWFQPREHGGSSYKFLRGVEYQGEIANLGEQVWYRLASRVASGRGKFEPRFAKGFWVGKSEFDDQHLVVDLERGLLKARTVRRMPIEFRWQPDMLKLVNATPWDPKVGIEDEGTGQHGGRKPRGMYITEAMIDKHKPTDGCPKCSTGLGKHSDECRKRFERIQADLLAESLAERPADEDAVMSADLGAGEAADVALPGAASSAGAGGNLRNGDLSHAASPAQGANTSSHSTEQNRDADMVLRAPARYSSDLGMDGRPALGGQRSSDVVLGAPARYSSDLGMSPESVASGALSGDGPPTKQQRIAGLAVCELAVCEEHFSETHDPIWDPIPSAANRCYGRCEAHDCTCSLRVGHDAECACRRCLISAIAALVCTGASEVTHAQVCTLAAVAARRESDTVPTVHYDYYTGEPLDEDLYQQGKDDELQAMGQYGVYTVVPISQATGGKHVRGFPIAHMKRTDNGWIVRWRFVAAELNLEQREDNQQGTPPLMVVRAVLSLAASKPDNDGKHRRYLRKWDVRKAFFNAELDELIYVHPGKELCEPGYCWWIHKAVNGTRKASQLWGEAIRAVFDANGWYTVRTVDGVYALPDIEGESGADQSSATCVCHGDDFHSLRRVTSAN